MSALSEKHICVYLYFCVFFSKQEVSANACQVDVYFVCRYILLEFQIDSIFYYTFAASVILTAVSSLLWMALYCCGQRLATTRVLSFASFMFTVVGNLCFTPIVVALLSALDCVYPEHSSPILRAMPSVICWEGVHLNYAIAAVISVVVLNFQSVFFLELWQRYVLLEDEAAAVTESEDLSFLTSPSNPRASTMSIPLATAVPRVVLFKPQFKRGDCLVKFMLVSAHSPEYFATGAYFLFRW